MLGIESTAHTFGVGIIDDNLNILSDVRTRYTPPKGMGMEPFQTAEHHSKYSVDVVKEALDRSGLSPKELDAIAYSRGPGFGPCLRIGATIARALALKYNIPLYPVHHAIGHIELVRSMFNLSNPLVILVSGGHTAITAFRDGRWRSYGETLDITVGNLFDVFAREAGLDFPGGPVIERLASQGSMYIELPYNIKGSNFQFSGLLTRALQLLEEGIYSIKDLSYSLQETAFSIIVEAAERALASLKEDIDSIAVTGGVASNNTLYQKLVAMADLHGLKVYRLENRWNGDNGIQIAIVGLRLLQLGIEGVKPEEAYIQQRWRFDEVDIPWM